MPLPAVSFITAGQTEGQQPENRPNRMQKMYRTGRLVEKPQNKNTDAEEPIEEMRTHVREPNLSVKEPIIARPIVADIFTSISVRVESQVDVPKTTRA